MLLFKKNNKEKIQITFPVESSYTERRENTISFFQTQRNLVDA